MDCIFCKIAQGLIPANKVYEDEAIIAFLDVNPASKGHTLVVTKRHFQDFTQVPKDLLAHAYQVAQLVSQACLTQLGASGVNVLTNIGHSAGQSVLHFHIHVIPRYDNDVLGAPFSHHLALPSDQLPLLADSIRKGL